jgi:hypothetical protein
MVALKNNYGKKALLAKFTQKTWSANKEDNSASKELKTKKNTADTADVRVIKKIIDNVNFDRLGHIVGLAYRYHQTMTVPWMYRGVGLLPITLHSKYTEQLRKFKAELEEAKLELMKILPTIIQQEKESGRLGNLFNEADYPMENLANYFDFTIQFFPVPEAGHFMVDLQNEAIDEVKQAFVDAEKEAVKTATGDLWQRIYKVVNTMAERLSDKDSKIFDSLVGNITDLCALLPELNVTNDPQLNKMVREIESKLTTTETITLRTDKKVRKEVAKSAKEILASMQEMEIS